MVAVRVSRKGADRVRSGHPWIFSSDVIDRSTAAPGDDATVVDPKGQTLGVAHYSSTSQICLRMLSDRVEPLDSAFYTRRIEVADAYRKRVVRSSNAYRMVHGEADRLPGLIIDRYGDYFTLQTLDQGMDRAKETIVACLQELFAPLGIVARNDAAVRARESLPRESGVLSGVVPELAVVHMNGLIWHCDLLRGQKTGVFLDQRENYLAAQRYAHGKALDCFTATGGFALQMAAQCESVEAVDSSAASLATARANAASNAITNVEFREADVFDLLPAYASARRPFQTIVLDPPAFAKSRSAVDAAMRGYKEINLRALRLLSSGGVLVTCSCSHHLSEAALLEVLAAASLDAGRTLRVLERRTQSQDHAILLTVPETHYLKCLIVEVV